MVGDATPARTRSAALTCLWTERGEVRIQAQAVDGSLFALQRDGVPNDAED
jgi:hypothetical protein